MPKRFSLALIAMMSVSLAGCDAVFGPSQTVAITEAQGSEDFLEYLTDARREMREGNLTQAGEWLDEARQLEPENPAVWVDIARLRFRGGEHIPALEAANLALELGPNYPPALLMRAQLVRDAHGMLDALPWFEAALANDPENPEMLAEYAATLGDAGYHQEMLAAVRKLAEVDPREPMVHYLQAVLAARGDRPVLARALLERSGLADRGVPAAILLDAILDMRQGTVETAAQKLEDLAERQPGNQRVLELLARALWLAGRDDELIDTFGERALAQDTSPYLLMLVGRAYERAGLREEAVPFLNRALAPRPSEPVLLGSTRAGRADLPAPTRQMRDLIAQRDAAGAVSLARQLRDQFPGSADVHSLIGDVEQARSRPDWAFELYETAASVRKPWPLTKRLITASRSLGDQNAADTLLIRHLVGEPNNTEALILFAERSATNEDWLRVSVLLDQAIELGVGSDPDLLELRAEAARQLGRDDEATQYDALAQILRPAPFVKPQ